VDGPSYTFPRSTSEISYKKCWLLSRLLPNRSERRVNLRPLLRDERDRHETGEVTSAGEEQNHSKSNHHAEHQGKHRADDGKKSVDAPRQEPSAEERCIASRRPGGNGIPSRNPSGTTKGNAIAIRKGRPSPRQSAENQWWHAEASMANQFSGHATVSRARVVK